MKAVAPLRIEDQAAGLWPHVCAKTGVPASFTVEVDVLDRPAWPWLLLPFSIIAVLISRSFAKRTLRVHVTVTPAAWVRHRRLVASALLFGALLVLGGTQMLRTGALDDALLAAAGAVVAGVLVHHLTWFHATIGGDHVFVADVHPAFQAAALELDHRDDHLDTGSSGTASVG